MISCVLALLSWNDAVAIEGMKVNGQCIAWRWTEGDHVHYSKTNGPQYSYPSWGIKANGYPGIIGDLYASTTNYCTSDTHTYPSYTTYYWTGSAWQQKATEYNVGIKEHANGACTAETRFPMQEQFYAFFQSKEIPKNQYPSEYWPTGPPDPETCSDNPCAEEKEAKILECGGEDFVDWLNWSDETCTGPCGDCTDKDADGVCKAADPDDDNSAVTGDLVLTAYTTYKGQVISQSWTLRGLPPDQGISTRYAPGWDGEIYNEEYAKHPGDFNPTACPGLDGCNLILGPRCGEPPACGTLTPPEELPDLPPVDRPPPDDCLNHEAECAAFCSDKGGVVTDICAFGVSSCVCENGVSTATNTDPETGVKTTTERTPDGTEKTTTVNPDGSKEISYSNSNTGENGEINVNPDGSGTGTYNNGEGKAWTEETVSPDGVKTTTTHYPDGSSLSVIEYGQGHDGLSQPQGNNTGIATGSTGGSTSTGHPSWYSGGGSSGGTSGTGTAGTGGSSGGASGTGNSASGPGGGASGTVTTYTDGNGNSVTTVNGNGSDQQGDGEADAEEETGDGTESGGEGGGGEDEPTEPTYVQERQLNWEPLEVAIEALQGKFPFSLFSDIQNEMSRFVATGKAPVFDISLVGHSTEIDLSIFDTIAFLIKLLIGISLTITMCWMLIRATGVVK